MYYRAFLLNIIKTLSIVSAAVFLFSCSSEEEKDKMELSDNGSTSLFRVIRNGKWGYTDGNGIIIIKPQFDDAEDFSGDIARVKVGAKYGYIDKTGEFIIKPQFDKLYDFSEGLAAVKVGDKWGYIDMSGELVITPQFDLAFCFSEGIAKVKIGDKYKYIDKTGKFVDKIQSDLLEDFSGGDSGGNQIKSEEVVLTTFNLTSRIEGGITEIKEYANKQFIIVDNVYPLIKQNDINLPFELRVNRGTNPTYLLEKELSKITENLESLGFIKENETNYSNKPYNHNYTNFFNYILLELYKNDPVFKQAIDDLADIYKPYEPGLLDYIFNKKEKKLKHKKNAVSELLVIIADNINVHDISDPLLDTYSRKMNSFKSTNTDSLVYPIFNIKIASVFMSIMSISNYYWREYWKIKNKETIQSIANTLNKYIFIACAVKATVSEETQNESYKIIFYKLATK